MGMFWLCAILMGIICYLGFSIDIMKSELEEIKKILESKE